jgi:hypothetical protein
MIKEKGTGEMYASKAAMKKHEKAEGPAMQKKEKAMMKKTKAKKASPLKQGVSALPPNKKTQYKTAEKTVARGVAKRTPILMKKSC